MSNSQDSILQQACPTIMVPLYEEMSLLSRSGHRFLAAADGLWMEIKRPWLHIIWPLAQQNAVAMPYGNLKQSISFSFDCIPAEPLDQFMDDACRTLPNEFAAWIVWNSETKAFSYRPLLAKIAGPVYLNLERPVLGEHEHLVVDIHSHGHLPAVFSKIDDMDDAGEVKLSVVIGSLGVGQTATRKLRLCANGITIGADILKELTGLQIKRKDGFNS